MSKPERVTTLAKGFLIETEADKEKAKILLEAYYDSQILKHEHEEQNSWCRMEPFNYNVTEFDDKKYKFISIVWKVRGRAWYIMRNFRNKK